MPLLAGLGPLGIPELLIMAFLAMLVGVPLLIVIMMAAGRGSAAPPPVAGAPRQAAEAPAMEQLERLAALRERGALSQQEYEEAKAKLLGKL